MEGLGTVAIEEQHSRIAVLTPTLDQQDSYEEDCIDNREGENLVSRPFVRL
jgi:hypothetical protein